MRYLMEATLIAGAAAGGWLLAAPPTAPAPPAAPPPHMAAAAPMPRIAAPGPAAPGGEEEEDEAAAPARRFSLCHTGGGTNCVVDGDTFWIDGEKIRISDIDAPETHPPRCPDEARLGEAATLRLQALLSAGPITLEIGDRPTDRYGRALRIVTRGGKSLGEQLVGEGLARRWTGRRQPWCAAAG